MPDSDSVAQLVGHLEEAKKTAAMLQHLHVPGVENPDHLQHAVNELVRRMGDVGKRILIIQKQRQAMVDLKAHRVMAVGTKIHAYEQLITQNNTLVAGTGALQRLKKDIEAFVNVVPNLKAAIEALHTELKDNVKVVDDNALGGTAAAAKMGAVKAELQKIKVEVEDITKMILYLESVKADVVKTEEVLVNILEEKIRLCVEMRKLFSDIKNEIDKSLHELSSVRAEVVTVGQAKAKAEQLLNEERELLRFAQLEAQRETLRVINPENNVFTELQGIRGFMQGVNEGNINKILGPGDAGERRRLAATLLNNCNQAVKYLDKMVAHQTQVHASIEDVLNNWEGQQTNFIAGLQQHVIEFQRQLDAAAHELASMGQVN
jgi:chromosome segregation ATPase